VNTVPEPSGSLALAPGSHACWVVRDPAAYVDHAAAVLGQAARTGEKPVVFGPEGSEALRRLMPLAAVAADPHSVYLDGGGLDPETMFAMFEVETARARHEGYRGLRLVADMDWLLPAGPTTEAIIGFELLLDRHSQRLGATIVCAYREASFDMATLTGALCVHPIGIGARQAAPFRLVAGAPDLWRLLGEVDIGDAEHFHTAITTAVGSGTAMIDASGLAFIDVAGLRRIARAGRASAVPLRIVGAPLVVRRSWRLAGFGEVAPTVEFVG
jgi:anti-anti-sigma regulatory factor